MYRGLVIPRTPYGVYSALVNPNLGSKAGNIEFKTIEDAKKATEATITNPNYSTVFTQGYDAIILDMEHLVVVSRYRTPKAPEMRWEDLAKDPGGFLLNK